MKEKVTKKIIDPPHRDLFFDNSKEVLRLLEIHKIISGDGPGYKHNVEVLNKSAIVLLVATWESYIEELAANCFTYLLENCNGHCVIPPKVRVAAARSIKESKNELDIWKIAGDGWISVLKEHKNSMISKYVNTLNTPKAEKIDELFENLIGLKGLSGHWVWRNMSMRASKQKLEEIIGIRGEIAHAVKTSKKVSKSLVRNYDEFLNKLAMISHNRCVDHLSETCGNVPWTKYRIGNII